jgi:alkylhydroperoxidase family enzyme
MKTLLNACVKLTRTPWAMCAADVEELRNQGFDDTAIHDAFQVTAYFNYINRVTDGLGIDLEEEMSPRPAGWIREW